MLDTAGWRRAVPPIHELKMTLEPRILESIALARQPRES